MNNEIKCPHCHGDLRLYEDPLASKMLADYETDSFNVRNVLLECLALLGVKNVAAADECLTMDVAKTLKEKIREQNGLVDALNGALLCHIKTELGL